MIFLGIDPGLATIGFGVVKCENDKLKFVDCGVIRTAAEMPLAERLEIIKNDLGKLLKRYKPNAAGVEEIFFARNTTNAIKVAHARGVILAEIAAHKIPIYEFTPLQVKNNICGYGQADKIQMQEMVKRSLGLKSLPKPDDAADALGVAICASRSKKIS